MAMQSGFIKRIRDIMRMDAGINGDAQRIEQMVWMLFLKVYDAKEDDWELNEDNYESIIPEDLRWRNWAKADENGHAMTGDKLLSFVNNTLFPVLKGNDVKEEIQDILALTLARAAAIVYGQVLSNEEMVSLVDNLFACPSPNYTPDGRVVLTTIKEEEIDKLFR